MAEFENDRVGKCLLIKGIIEISLFMLKNINIRSNNIASNNYFPKSEYTLQLEKRVEELQRELQAKELISRTNKRWNKQ